MRRERPPSDSELTTEAKPFSISSIMRTHGAMRSAVASARSRFFSDSPMNLSKSRPGSSLRSGKLPSLGDGLGGQALPAALHAQEQDAARGGNAELLGLGRKRLAAASRARS